MRNQTGPKHTQTEKGQKPVLWVWRALPECCILFLLQRPCCFGGFSGPFAVADSGGGLLSQCYYH